MIMEGLDDFIHINLYLSETFLKLSFNAFFPLPTVYFRIFAMMPDFLYRANPNPLHIEIVVLYSI